VAVATQELSVDALAARLRAGSPPVVGRIRDDLLILNPRTLFAEEEGAMINALQKALSTAKL
jgi:L-seryl-tRNA(Ser) seleniumtransferase